MFSVIIPSKTKEKAIEDAQKLITSGFTATLAKDEKDKEVVFVGEYHDSPNAKNLVILLKSRNFANACVTSEAIKFDVDE